MSAEGETLKAGSSAPKVKAISVPKPKRQALAGGLARPQSVLFGLALFLAFALGGVAVLRWVMRAQLMHSGPGRKSGAETASTGRQGGAAASAAPGADAAERRRSPAPSVALQDQAAARVRAGNGPVHLGSLTEEPAQALKLERLSAHLERDADTARAEIIKLAVETQGSERLIPQAGFVAHLVDTHTGGAVSTALPFATMQWLSSRASQLDDPARRVDAGEFLTLLLGRLDPPFSGLGLLSHEACVILSGVPDNLVTEAIRSNLGIRLGACLLALLPPARAALIVRGVGGNLAQKLLVTLASESSSYKHDDAEQVMEHFKATISPKLVPDFEGHLSQYCGELLGHLPQPHRKVMVDGLNRSEWGTSLLKRSAAAADAGKNAQSVSPQPSKRHRKKRARHRHERLADQLFPRPKA